MRGKERGRWFDEAISAFARIARTPIGPGMTMVRSAISRRCSTCDGWGDELGAAKAALAARLFTLGDQRGTAQVLTFVARLIGVAATHAAARITPRRDGRRCRRMVDRTVRAEAPSLAIFARSAIAKE